ncbi:hypothetical protein Mal15_55170 [Stieleria maiorica]|uniref:Uncharacterized protein n=1 Tax=Stieleria maiorica TaxID=2795974 RepID=A0A5B9MN17_9BACT|nr:hypothetical protein [Stieleria maiorica]QEG01441.1 hypothetical protein Mal15_55170 [Stieleria maiorica]
MKRTVIAAVMIAVAGMWFVMNRTAAQQSSENQHAEKIAELMQQRHDVLQQHYEVIKRRYADGRFEYDQVISAMDALLKAKLDLAKSKQERLDICKQRVDNLRSLEQWGESRLKSGVGAVEETMLATAARIQAEIDCLREEQ